MPEDTLQKIESFFTNKREPSKLSLYLQQKLLTSKNRDQISCIKLSESYYKETGLKARKSTINNVLKTQLGFHYLKSTLKSNFINQDKGRLYYFCFIKIFARAIKRFYLCFLR